jgi:hypothetical protein
METKTTKRRRPLKGQDRVKADYLDIKLGASEKETFKDAAELAGLDLSAWVKERLRMAAQKELEAAGLPVVFLTKDTRPEHLINARFVAPSTIILTFADACLSLAIKRLEMPVDRIRWTTVAALPTGDAIKVKGIKGDVITIDSGTLRYLADKKYAATIAASLKSLQLTRDELKKIARDNPPPPEWFSEPERDLRHDSWK